MRRAVFDEQRLGLGTVQPGSEAMKEEALLCAAS